MRRSSFNPDTQDFAIYCAVSKLVEHEHDRLFRVGGMRPLMRQELERRGCVVQEDSKTHSLTVTSEVPFGRLVTVQERASRRKEYWGAGLYLAAKWGGGIALLTQGGKLVGLGAFLWLIAWWTFIASFMPDVTAKERRQGWLIALGLLVGGGLLGFFFPA